MSRLILMSGAWLLSAFTLASQHTVTTAWQMGNDIVSPGGRVSYSATTGKLAYDKLQGDGYFDVCVAALDGSGETCPTIDHADLSPNKHIGTPDLNPAGTWLLFQVQKDDSGCTDAEASPGIGGCNALYVMPVGGGTATQLRDVEAGPDGALLHPHWNGAGTKVGWSEQTVESPGAWQVCSADISLSGTPSLSDITCVAPAARDTFYEFSGFTADGRLMMTCLCDAADDTFTDIDVAVSAADGSGFTKLTDTNNVWDEFLHELADGRFVWSSSGIAAADPLRLDYWIMDADGSHKRRLTFFNIAGHVDYSASQIAPTDFEIVDGSRWVGLVLTSPTAGPIRLFQLGLRPPGWFAE